MDILNRVGKGVRAAGQGVVGVGKGVGLGVKTAGTAVGKTAVGAAKGGVNVAATAGTAVGKTAVGAAKGGVNVAATAGKVGVSGVTTVGKAGVSAAGAVGGTAVHLGKTAVDAGASGVRTISGRNNSPKRQPGDENSMEIYCSDFYTEEFVLGEIEKARNDRKVVNLKFEDMILRESPEIIEAATKLLLDTVGAKGDAMLDDSSSRGSSRGVRARMSRHSFGKKAEPKDPHAAIRRAYESITFVECISSAMDYQTYLEEKEIFQENLLGRQKIRRNVPIRFKTKIELHTMLGGDDVKELLKEIEKDEAITGVDFPDFRGKDRKRIPALFMRSFDAKNGEWKQDASPIEIQLRYGEEDNMAASLDEESGFLELEDNPRKLISKCLKRLECGDDSDELGGSKRGVRKRSSKGKAGRDDNDELGGSKRGVRKRSPKQSGGDDNDELGGSKRGVRKRSPKGSGGDDNDELGGSKRGVRKRSPKGMPTKRVSEGGVRPKPKSKSPPRKCMSEGAPTTRKLTEGALTKLAKEAPATIPEEPPAQTKRAPKLDEGPPSPTKRTSKLEGPPSPTKRTSMDDGPPSPTKRTYKFPLDESRGSSHGSRGSSHKRVSRVTSNSSTKSNGSKKRVSGGANVKRESDASFLDGSFSWNEDNEILNAELKPEEKALMGLSKSDHMQGKPKKSASSKKSTSSKRSAAPQTVRQ